MNTLEEKKKLAIYHLKNNVSVPQVAEKLDLPISVIDEWNTNLDTFSVSQSMEDVVSLVQQNIKKDENYDVIVLEQLRSTLGELALFCAKKLPDTMHNKEESETLHTAISGISLLYKTFFTTSNTNIAVIQTKPNDTGITQFKDMLKQ